MQKQSTASALPRSPPLWNILASLPPLASAAATSSHQVLDAGEGTCIAARSQDGGGGRLAQLAPLLLCLPFAPRLGFAAAARRNAAQDAACVIGREVDKVHLARHNLGRGPLGAQRRGAGLSPRRRRRRR